MGQYLQRIEKDTEAELAHAESRLAALHKSKEWEATKTAADIAGIVDPTPASDSVSLAMSLVENDWVGAFLSGLSFIPYIGDAVGKPFKMVRGTKVIMRLEQEAAALAKTIDHYKSNAIKFAQRKMAAAVERTRRAKEAGERFAQLATCKPCANKMTSRFGTQLPTKGVWHGEKGNSLWTSEGKPPVTMNFKEGYPEFKTSNPPSLYPKGEVEIEMMGKDSDFTNARKAMQDKLGDPKWPGNNKDAPDGYTWHHVEDGATMQLVQRNIHDKAKDGPAHVGGESIVSGKDNFKQDTQF